MQDDDTKVLKEVYKTARMGAGSIKKLIERIDDEQIKSQMISQLDNYRQVMNETEQELLANNAAPKGEGFWTKAMKSVNIRSKSLKEPISPTEASEMMIQGSTMGIIELRKALNEYSDANQDVKKRARKLIKFEQENINAFNAFL